MKIIYSFQIKLDLESCHSQAAFQNDRNVVDTIQQSFKLPKCCLFPVNNAYVSYDDIRTGHKFVVANGDENKKLRQFFEDKDYLFFVQNLDLLTKTCTGGLLFVVGDTLAGVLLDNAFEFLMDGCSLDDFIEVRKNFFTCIIELVQNIILS